MRLICSRFMCNSWWLVWNVFSTVPYVVCKCIERFRFCFFFRRCCLASFLAVWSRSLAFLRLLCKCCWLTFDVLEFERVAASIFHLSDPLISIELIQFFGMISGAFVPFIRWIVSFLLLFCNLRFHDTYVFFLFVSYSSIRNRDQAKAKLD